jgi:2-oxoacid:acceptor oxidoreductase gamma subunit (pyruvate/2-ketoisovalerate family)
MIMYQIVEPDVVVILDPTLLKYDEVLSGLREGGWLIVNSSLPPQELNLKEDCNLATADATSVCCELGLVVAGATVVDTAILGAFVRATGAVSLTNIERVIAERFSGAAQEANLTAVRRTYQITKVRERSEARVGHKGLSAYLR